MTGRVYLFATLLLAAPVVGSASDDCTPDYTASVGQFETAFEYWSGHANNPKNDPYGNTPDNADAGTTTGACDDEYLHMIARYMSAYETYEYRKTNSYTSAPTGTPTLSPSSTPTLSPSSPPTLAPSVATTAEADGVAFTITFSNLDINSFSNETFAASFNSAFRDQMAKTANVSWEYVTILEISSGSVAVSTIVHFTISSSGSADIFKDQVLSEPDSMFQDQSFSSWGAVTSSKVSVETVIVPIYTSSPTLAPTLSPTSAPTLTPPPPPPPSSPPPSPSSPPPPYPPPPSPPPPLVITLGSGNCTIVSSGSIDTTCFVFSNPGQAVRLTMSASGFPDTTVDFITDGDTQESTATVCGFSPGIYAATGTIAYSDGNTYDITEYLTILD
eukprot:gene30653-38367_t